MGAMYRADKSCVRMEDLPPAGGPGQRWPSTRSSYSSPVPPLPAPARPA